MKSNLSSFPFLVHDFDVLSKKSLLNSKPQRFSPMIPSKNVDTFRLCMSKTRLCDVRTKVHLLCVDIQVFPHRLRRLSFLCYIFCVRIENQPTYVAAFSGSLFHCSYWLDWLTVCLLHQICSSL